MQRISIVLYYKLTAASNSSRLSLARCLLLVFLMVYVAVGMTGRLCLPAV